MSAMATDVADSAGANLDEFIMCEHSWKSAGSMFLNGHRFSIRNSCLVLLSLAYASSYLMRLILCIIAL